MVEVIGSVDQDSGPMETQPLRSSGGFVDLTGLSPALNGPGNCGYLSVRL